MKFSLLAILILSVAAPARTARAQGQDQFTWGIAGGPTIVTRDGHDNHTSGGHGTLMIGVGSVDSPFGVRIDGMYTVLGDRKGSGLVTDQGAARVTSLMGNILFNVYGSDKRLYVIGGIGAYGYNPDGSGTKSLSDFGVNAGAGLWIPRFNGFVEARWFSLYRALPDQTSGLRGKKTLMFYPISFGVMF